MKYIVTLNDKQYEVEVEKGKAVAAYIGEAPAPAPVAAAPLRCGVSPPHRSLQSAGFPLPCERHCG